MAEVNTKFNYPSNSDNEIGQITGKLRSIDWFGFYDNRIELKLELYDIDSATIDTINNLLDSFHSITPIKIRFEKL